MLMCNLNEYSDNYIKTSGSFWQYYKDEPNDNLTDSESLKSKVKITGKTPVNDNAKDVEIVLLLNYLSNAWRTVEMPLINCDVNLIFSWLSTCVITNSTGQGRFKITDTKISTKDNTKLLQQLKSGFRKTISWNKYQSDPKTCTKQIFKSLNQSRFLRSK